MPDIALRTANNINVVESLEQHTGVAGVAIVAGQLVSISSATGRFILATDARVYGVALRTARVGESLTALRKGVLEGYVLDALAYDADIFLNPANGNANTAAGAPSVVVGRVLPGHYNFVKNNPDKLMLVDLG